MRYRHAREPLALLFPPGDAHPAGAAQVPSNPRPPTAAASATIAGMAIDAWNFERHVCLLLAAHKRQATSNDYWNSIGALHPQFDIAAHSVASRSGGSAGSLEAQ